MPLNKLNFYLRLIVSFLMIASLAACVNEDEGNNSYSIFVDVRGIDAAAIDNNTTDKFVAFHLKGSEGLIITPEPIIVIQDGVYELNSKSKIYESKPFEVLIASESADIHCKVTSNQKTIAYSNNNTALVVCGRSLIVEVFFEGTVPPEGLDPDDEIPLILGSDQKALKIQADIELSENVEISVRRNGIYKFDRVVHSDVFSRTLDDLAADSRIYPDFALRIIQHPITDGFTENNFTCRISEAQNLSSNPDNIIYQLNEFYMPTDTSKLPPSMKSDSYVQLSGLINSPFILNIYCNEHIT